jgi:hypothetical protein
MTSLIGTILLGSTFTQDANINYIKINNVGLGESSKYGYKVLKSNDIGALLNTLIQDQNVAVVVYHWKSGTAYIKKGFDISVQSDSKLAPGYTTFIVKSKLPPIFAPTTLIGQTLLGSKFVQDTKPNYIKIDKVSLGDTYNYKQTVSNNIGGILDSSLLDSKIVCIVYKWSTGEAFIKSGFNLSNNLDTKTNNDFTTFIVKNKVSQFWPNNSVVPVTPIPVPPQNASNFVKWENNNFILNNDKFVPIGFNCYILGYTEEYGYPTHKEIDEVFDIALKMSATTIRSHTLGISSGSQNSLRPYDNTLNNSAWEPIDYSFFKAKQTNIKLICPLTDCYSWYNGSYGDFCKKYNLPKNDFWTNSTVRNDFKQFINDWLNHTNQYTNIKIKDSP